MPTGAGAYAIYGYEEVAFKTAAASINKLFGVGTKLDRDENNNMLKIYSLGQRPASNVVPTAFTGKAGIEFVLSNPWFLKAVFGGMGVATTKTGTGPYSYWFVDTANTNGGGAVEVSKMAPSMTIENGVNITGTSDPISKLLGCVVDTFTLTIASNDAVKCKLDLDFADVNYSKSAYALPGGGILDTFDPFIYSQGILQLPDSTTIANVTNATITFKNNSQMITGIGARSASAYVTRQLDIEIKATVLFDSVALLEKLYGSTTFSTLPDSPTETTLSIILDNGLLTTANRRIEFKFAKAWINQSTIKQAVEEAMMQEITLVTAQPLLVKATNNTATEP